MCVLGWLFGGFVRGFTVLNGFVCVFVTGVLVVCVFACCLTFGCLVILLWLLFSFGLISSVFVLICFGGGLNAWLIKLIAVGLHKFGYLCCLFGLIVLFSFYDFIVLLSLVLLFTLVVYGFLFCVYFDQLLLLLLRCWWFVCIMVVWLDLFCF